MKIFETKHTGLYIDFNIKDWAFGIAFGYDITDCYFSLALGPIEITFMGNLV